MASRHLVKTYSAQNVTPGTGIAEAVKTSFAATAAMAIVRNGGSRILVRPKFIRLINTVVPASATRGEMVIALDSGVTRYASGATALTTPANRDQSSSVASSTVCRFGALVTNAATASVRYIARAQVRTAIPVVYEEYLIRFQKPADPAGGVYGLMGGTATVRTVVDAGPVVLGPSQEMILHTWWPSNATTPASWEVEMEWEESFE